MRVPNDNGQPVRAGPSPGSSPGSEAVTPSGLVLPHFTAPGLRWVRLDPDLPVEEEPAPQVWKINLDQPDDTRWQRLLSDAERERAHGLADPQAQRRFMVAHAALRSILGEECGVSAAQIEFGTEPAGRPYLVLPGEPAPLDFNLSHSGEWALVAVTQPGWRVGIDLERIRTDVDYLGMARHMFQPTELARLQQQTDPLRRLLEYFLFWSAKEAYVKAVGVGLPGFRDVLVCREGDALYGTVLSTAAGSPIWPVRWLDVAPGYAAAIVNGPPSSTTITPAIGL